ncbi:MAG: DUF11 domain-containing protein, partial [Caldilinea sp. CFX5]|nr:DUF11 domain-containing protein [Caldilinea sp. CFX5]
MSSFIFRFTRNFHKAIRLLTIAGLLASMVAGIIPPPLVASMAPALQPLADLLDESPLGPSVVRAEGALSFTKTLVDTPTPVSANDIVKYRLTFSCSSLETGCGDLTVTDQLPTQYFTYLTTTTPPGYTAHFNSGTGQLTITRQNMLDGDTADAIVVMRVKPGVPGSITIPNTAQATITLGPGDQPITYDAGPVTVTTAPPDPQWSVSKQRIIPSASTIPALDTDVTYRVNLCADRLSGNTNLLGAELTDLYPAGAQVVSASGGVVNAANRTITWTLGDIDVVQLYQAAGLTSGPVCISKRVVLHYPSTTFTLSDRVSNEVAATGAYSMTGATEGPIGDPNHPISNTHGFAPPGADVILDKTAYNTVNSAGLPQTWYLAVDGSTSNVPIANLVISDVLTSPQISDTVSIFAGAWTTDTGVIKADVQVSDDNGANWTTLGTVDGDDGTTWNAPTDFAKNITHVRWLFFTEGSGGARLNTVPQGFVTASSPTIRQTVADSVQPGDTITNCGALRHDNGSKQDCQSVAVVLHRPEVQVTKANLGSPLVSPNDEVTYRLTIGHGPYDSTGAIVNPTLTDLLPAEMEFVGIESVTVPNGGPQPNYNVIDNFDGSGRQLIRFSWRDVPPASSLQVDGITPGISNPFTLPLGAPAIEVRLITRIKPATAAGNYTNEAGGTEESNLETCKPLSAATTDTTDEDGDGDTTEDICKIPTEITVQPASVMESQKWVKGPSELPNVDDPGSLPAIADALCPNDGDGFTRFPCVARIYPNGQFTYKLRLRNVGNTPIKDYILYDVFPFAGDKGVSERLAGFNRASAWQPTLLGPITPVDAFTQNLPGLVIEYSDANNACRPEVKNGTDEVTPWPAGCVDDWTVTPDDYTDVRAFRIKVPFTTAPHFQILETMLFTMTMLAPGDAATDTIAWNSLVHRSTNADNNARLEAAEPRKVGVLVPDYPARPIYFDMALRKQLATGQATRILPGGDVTFAIEVINQGTVTTTDITVVDYLPTGFSLSNSDTNGWTSSGATATVTLPGPLGPGAKSTVNIVLTAPVLLTGTFTNTAEIQSVMDLTGTLRTDDIDSTADATNDDTVIDNDLSGNAKFVPDHDEDDHDVQRINVIPPVIGDRIWVESDRDGDATTGTITPVANHVVTLTTSTGAVYTTMTNASGYYSFTMQTAGVYTITTSAPAGTIPSVYAGAPGNNQSHDPAGAPVVITTGDDFTIDFGFRVPTYSLGNRVWFDTGAATNNSIQDGDESGVAGVTMQLLDNNGAVIATATTDANGYYRFDELSAGDYRVRVAASNFTPGGPLANYGSSLGASSTFLTADDQHDTGVDTLTPAVNGVTSNVVTLGPGVTPTNEPDVAGGAGAHGPDGDAYDNLTVDFGFVPLVQVGNQLWIEADNDGDVTTGAIIPVPSHVVTLTTSTGAVLTTTTDANGYYAFALPVNSGTYTITTSTPPGTTVSNNQSNDPVGTPVTIGAGNDLSIDFGFNAPLHDLGNRVWFDMGAAANNGIQEGDEVGAANVRVELLDLNGNPVLYNSRPLSTTTDANGYYRFDHLPAGAYYVRVAASNFATNGPLAKYVSSTGASSGFTTADDQHDSGVDAAMPAFTGVTSNRVTLGANDPTSETDTATGAGAHGPNGDATDNLTVDFGFWLPVQIGNRLWIESDRDGNTSTGTITPVTGHVVTVTRSNGVVYTATTDVGGYYLVTVPGNDTYTVTTHSPAGTIPSVYNGMPSNNQSHDPAGAVVTVATTDDLTIDFGFHAPTYSLGNRIWFDTGANTNDGVHDGDETGVQGVTVELLDSNGAVLKTTTTNATGYYRFDDLAAGSYRVRVAASNFATGAPLANYVSSLGAGNTFLTADDQHDTGIDTLTPTLAGVTSAVVTLGPGANPLSEADIAADAGAHGPDGDAFDNLTVDFGFVPAVQVGNRLWLESDNDGDATTGIIFPLANHVVTLTTSTGQLFTTTTNGSGYYTFAVPANGVYTVTTVAPAGTTPSPLATNVATDANQAANENRNHDPAGTVVTVTNVDNLSVDFGFNTPPHSLGNRVWFDMGALRNNGAQEGDETGAANVVIELLNSSGQPVIAGGKPYTTTTDANGYYRFDHLPAGDYRVRIAASNFAPGAPLENYISSTGATTAFTTGDDQDDKGIDALTPSTAGITSNIVTLGANNPTSEADTAAGAGAHGPDGDASDNLTVDFGFWLPVQIGNRLWIEDDNDGDATTGYVQSVGAGHIVTATASSGQIFTATTNANGYYLLYVPASDTYTVTTDLPAGVVDAPVLASDGSDPLTDNNRNHDRLGTTVVVTTINNLSIDFGFYQAPGTIIIRKEANTVENCTNIVSTDAIDEDSANNSACASFYLIPPSMAGQQFAFASDIATSAGVTPTFELGIGEVYTFAGVLPGVYGVTETVPSDWKLLGASCSNGSAANAIQMTAGATITCVFTNTVTLRVDWGDLPDGNAVTSPNYHTISDTLSGPSHVITDGLYLGARVDAEVDGRPNATATGDGSDEDGITFPNFILGQSAVVTATVVNTTGQDAYLYGFIDFNGDGDFADASEAISATVSSNAVSQTIALNFTVPMTATMNLDLGARFRLSTDAALGPNGPANDGEVEDYLIQAGPEELLHLGNRVWYDVDNNGILDADEVGVAGVRVELYRDTNGDGAYTPGVDLLDRYSTTLAGGYYTFTNLLPEVGYLVVITGSNFTNSGVLYNYQNSDGVTAPSHTAADDDKDHGIVYAGSGAVATGAIPTGGYVASSVITLTFGSEPMQTAYAGDSNWTLDFGFYQMSLGNTVWHDLNNDGWFNNSEPGMAGVTVTLLSTTGAVIGVTTTDANGHYTFTGLISGAYVISVTPPLGYVSSDGQVLDDSGNNRDHGAPVGNAIVSQPFTLTPAGGVGTNETATPSTGQTENLKLDFGLWQPVSLGNRLWYDTNNDGSVSSGEQNMTDGVLVELYQDSDGDGVFSAGDSRVASTLISGGYYTFTNLMPSLSDATRYLVIISDTNFLPGGLLYGYVDSSGQYTDTLNAAGNNQDHGVAINRLGQPGGVVASSAISLTAGTQPTGEGNGGNDPIQRNVDANSNQTIDFGFYKLVLGNRIWQDLNNNGLDDSEPALSSLLVITATNQTTGDVYTTTTDANGYYTFTGIVSGTYVVSIDAPAGYVSSATDGSPNGVDLDDNGIGSNGGVISSAPFALTPGVTIEAVQSADDATGSTVNPSVDFGLWLPAALGNYVWLDTTTSDGSQNEAAINGINGVTVTLFYSNPVTGLWEQRGITQTANHPITNDPGYYTFTNLISGTYYVSFTLPYGYAFTTQDASSEATDSDANAITGATAPITLNAGEQNPNIDAGMVALTLSLGNRVWYDVNNNGQIDSNESGIAGVRVELYRDSDGNGLFTPGVDAYVTDSNTISGGYYTFTNLSEGGYLVVISSTNFSGVLLNYRSSDPTTADPNDNGDSDDNGLPAASGVVASGVITLTLDNEPDGSPAVDGDNDANTNWTVDFGFYLVDMGDAPNSYSTTMSNSTPYSGASHVVSPNLFLGSRVDADQDGQPVVTGAAATNDDTGVSAAAVGGIGDDEDGIVFANPLVAGQVVTVQVTVSGTGGYLNAWLDFGADGAWTQAGDQIFDGVAVSSGVNTLTFTVPLTASTNITTYARFRLSTAADLNFYDSDAPALDGEVEDYDLLIEPPAGIGDRVWYDDNYNGIQDENETGVMSVTVELLDSNGAVIMTTTTNASGNYSFTNLAPGLYGIRFVTSTLPAGYIITLRDQGGDNAADSDADPTTGRTVNTLLTTDEYDPDWDMGISRLVTIGDYVWVDGNGNGVQDGNEQGMEGVTVTLTTPSGSVITTWTDANGVYTFTNLLPNTVYTVTFSTPDGYSFTNPNQG